MCMYKSVYVSVCWERGEEVFIYPKFIYPKIIQWLGGFWIAIYKQKKLSYSGKKIQVLIFKTTQTIFYLSIADAHLK